MGDGCAPPRAVHRDGPRVELGPPVRSRSFAGPCAQAYGTSVDESLSYMRGREGGREGGLLSPQNLRAGAWLGVRSFVQSARRRANLGFAIRFA